MGSLSRLELDPNGDVELILELPNSQTLQWPPNMALGPGFDSKRVRMSKMDKRKYKKKQRMEAEAAAAARALEAISTLVVEEAASDPLVGEDAPLENLTARESDSPPATEEENKPGATIASTSAANEGSEPPVEPSSIEHIKPEGLRLLVSSRHLRLASSTFRSMLDGPWKEGATINTGAIRSIRATEWDTEAFLIVLDIIHDQMLAIPDLVELELLAKIAAIVDYYNCHDVMKPFIDDWTRMLQSHIPSSYGKECVLWMSISWVFLDVVILKKMAMLAIMDCQGPIETIGLPVPQTLLRRIELAQVSITRAILGRIERLSESLCNKADRCVNGCEDVVLGSLTRQSRGACIPSSDAIDVLQGRSVNLLVKILSGFTSTSLQRKNHPYGGYSIECPCDTLEKRIEPCLKESLQSLENVALEDIWSKRLEERDTKRQDLFAARYAWRGKERLQIN